MRKSHIIVFFIALAGCSPEKYVKAPVDSCKYEWTGRVRTETYDQCFPTNENACGILMPVQEMHRQYRVKCEFTEWGY